MVLGLIHIVVQDFGVLRKLRQIILPRPKPKETSPYVGLQQTPESWNMVSGRLVLGFPLVALLGYEDKDVPTFGRLLPQTLPPKP